MDEAFVELLSGNATHASQDQSRFEDVQDAQRPEAVTVSCSDSRVLQDHLWGNDTPGRLFSCSNIGNRVIQRTAAGEVVSGDVLYPLLHTGTDLVVIVGHTGCGAVTAAYDELDGATTEPPGIAHCLDRLTPHLEAGVEALPADLERPAAINRLVEYNVDRQVEHVGSSQHVPAETTVVGAVYDFQDIYSDRRGLIHVINVDGETAVNTLREDHPEIASRINRLWEYDGVAGPT